MIALAVTGLSVRAPGLGEWAQSRPIFTGAAPYDPAARLELPAPALLSPNERRRAGLVVRLALTVCEEASHMAGHAPGALPGIFGSSNGDGATVHELLEALSGPDQSLSPTRFHNSVHNAVAGYWAIATRSSLPVTCLGCHDQTFAAALLKAGAEAASTRAPVLLCVYDAPLKLPLGALRNTTIGLAAAFVLTPNDTSGPPLARLRLEFRPGPAGPELEPGQPALRGLRQSNPVGHALVLLEAIAKCQTATLMFRYATGSLIVETAA